MQRGPNDSEEDPDRTVNFTAGSLVLSIMTACSKLPSTPLSKQIPSHSVFSSSLIHEINIALRCQSSRDFVPFALYCHRLSKPVSESEIPKVTWYINPCERNNIHSHFMADKWANQTFIHCSPASTSVLWSEGTS